MRFLVITIVSLILAVSLVADWSIEQKIFAADGEVEDYFGESVSISGDFAIVGAPLNNYPDGAAYLYQKVNDQWLLSEKLLASDSIYTMGFGSSVFINNDYMIISANHNYNNSSGSAYIYYHDCDNWNEIAIIAASGSPICDQYGCSVGISESGDYAVVGAYSDDENGEHSGAVYIYQRNGSEWNLQMKIMALDGEINDSFGFSTFITDNYLFVSATGDCDNGDDSGSIYVYENNGTTWEFHSKLIASHNTSNDRFGRSISVCDDLLIVGTYCYDQGEAYVFRNDNSSWIEETILTASDGFSYDRFGCSVSISGDFIIVGACNRPDVATSASAYFFEQDGSDWVELNKLTIDNWGAFGYSVSISDENAIVGANLDCGISNATGAAYLILNDETSIDQQSITSSVNIRNYPNPFNPSTIIEFSIQNNSKINLSINNIKGQKVRVLADNVFTQGSHSIIWNGDNESGNSVSSGIYYYKLIVNGKTEVVKKCLLLK
ncbi:MAG: T9SS type A sorting domain-containing protein [Candidatus Delongbacteria bacterium]|nr:T9SS type A sorting domain-containing protein [Candidatus Delongbacteria bacterium]